MDTEQKFTLQQIIEQSFDFESYSTEEKQSLIDETTGMIIEATVLRLLGESNEQMQIAFSALIETNPDEQTMTDFITTNFPNFNEVLVDEIKVFKSIGEEKPDTQVAT